MKIVHDENIPYAAEFFAPLGQLLPCDGRSLNAAKVADADVLLVRSVTPVTAALLSGSRVRFVASATIGTDHVDQVWLASQGIAFANAPGCNAHGVVDYVLSALWQLAEGEWSRIAARRIGVVGVGNVGGRLVERLEALGLNCWRCDPLRAEREGGAFYNLDQLLEHCDLICLHTPLTRDGAHPTQHLMNAERLARLLPGSWLINAGRGPVVDNQALKRLLPRRPDLRVVLDVWEPEPAVDPALVSAVQIATPHIAGYSLEGRCRGTEMIYLALCRHLGMTPQVSLAALLPVGPELRLTASDSDPIGRALRSCYQQQGDDARFREMVAAGALPAGFDRLRRDYPLRREFSACRLHGLGIADDVAQRLRGFGFQFEA
ncbi:MAG TPA: 4-phosphoerythronate dehydrogenase PdxB [Motiliproteus sp.]